MLSWGHSISSLVASESREIERGNLSIQFWALTFVQSIVLSTYPSKIPQKWTLTRLLQCMKRRCWVKTLTYSLEGLLVPKTLFLLSCSLWTRTWPQWANHQVIETERGSSDTPNGRICQKTEIPINQGWLWLRGIRCRQILGFKQTGLMLSPVRPVQMTKAILYWTNLTSPTNTDKPSPKKTNKLGKIVKLRWLNKLDETNVREKSEKYLRPINGDWLITPKVNPEIWGRLNRQTRGKDLKLSCLQTTLTKVGQIITQTTDLLLKARAADGKVDFDNMVRMNTDALALLGHTRSWSFHML